MSSPPDWTRPGRSSASGVNDSLLLDCRALRRSLEAGVKPAFPPSLVVQVKALACELPHTLGLPLSRLSIQEIRQHVISQGLIAEISGATLWRWLSSDALRPWQHRSWIFPRDPNFADKAGPILDLYERFWEGAPLGADDYVISADEKSSIQARRRKQPTKPPAASSPYSGRLDPRRTLGIAPKHSERFAYFRLEPEDDIRSVAELLAICATA